MLYSVRDGSRTLKFYGAKLAESTSRESYKTRWVEFQLYKTPKNQYILSRIGRSILYHKKQCSVTDRNSLSSVPVETLSPMYIPCPACKPNNGEIVHVFPETPRYWAQVCQDATGVVRALMKYDDNKIEYLTLVARDLLEDAAKNDTDIFSAYSVDFIE